MDLRVANDIGNSDTKMIVNGELRRQPSIVKFMLTKPTVVEDDVTRNISNLLDELVVNVTSESIKQSGLYAVGKKANLTNGTLRNMNIKLGNKYLHDVPVIMTLSLIAARAVQLDFEMNKELTDFLALNILMSSAIPASEYTPEKAKHLEGRFTETTHIVIVHVGNKQVTVKLKFDKVKVTQEGNPAIYGIVESPDEILDLYNEKYEKNASPKDFTNKKILHLDIGDGTTEYIYTIGPNPVNDASTGERRGVGHATEEALKLLDERMNGHVKLNRQQFMDVLRSERHNLKQEAENCMRLARVSQSYLILEDTKVKYEEKTSGDVDLISVYGGGSIQFFEDLYEDICEFADSVRAEVLWIPEKFAIDLNVKGLEVLNEHVFFKKGGK